MLSAVFQRELRGLLRSSRAVVLQLVPAIALTILVLLRWPSDARVGIAGPRAMEVFRLFAYGLTATVILLVPVFPATTLVREKARGTLALLLNAPSGSWAILAGKLGAMMVAVMLPLVTSLPAAAACYAMGGISLWRHVVPLYTVLLLAAFQYVAVALLVSAVTHRVDGSVRVTYAIVLLLSVVVIGPYQFLHGMGTGWLLSVAELLRAFSPIPAVMEIAGQGDIGPSGLIAASGMPLWYGVTAVVSGLACLGATWGHLRPTMFDNARDAGIVTDDRSRGGRVLRRALFIFDPQRRAKPIGPWTNPVLIKEFRSRRFGRSHWMARLIAACAVLSFLLTLAAVGGTIQWGVDTIGGFMVVLQAALIVLVTPALAAGLIPDEHESGGWTLLRMTPLSAGRIVLGKLLSALLPLLLILLATLPGYAVMMLIKPVLTQQILYVLGTLVAASVFALCLSATVGSLFQRTAPAVITSYAVLTTYITAPLLIWLGRDAPFGHDLVRFVLLGSPVAAGLEILRMPGFTQYDLLPAHWWILGMVSLLCLVVLALRTMQLTRPQ